MYHDVHGSPRAGIPPLVERWLPIRSIHTIERFILGLVQAYEGRQRRHAAIRDLQRLDDHKLQDLGIERGQISDVVDAHAAANRH